MLTDRTIEANRQNAQHSTGPSTPEGRAAVRLNGLKHGLCAETIVVPGEDPAEFEAMLEAYRAEYQPATPSAEFLVRQVAMADWRLLRLHRIEASFHTIRHKELELSRRLEDIQCDNDGRLAFIDWMDAGPKSLLANLHRYEIRLERSAKNARQELDRRPVALVSTAPVERPKAQPKTPPSPKIISNSRQSLLTSPVVCPRDAYPPTNIQRRTSGLSHSCYDEILRIGIHTTSQGTLEKT